jgi:hypothetical protein
VIRAAGLRNGSAAGSLPLNPLQITFHVGLPVEVAAGVLGLNLIGENLCLRLVGADGEAFAFVYTEVDGFIPVFREYEVFHLGTD